MKILVISHAYSSSDNRRDKLARIAQDSRIEALGVVIPRNWHDRMLDVPRAYAKIPEDDLYQTYLLPAVWSGSQAKYWYNPLTLLRIVRDFQPDLIHVEQELSDWILGETNWLKTWFGHCPLSVFIWQNLRRSYGFFSQWCWNYSLKHSQLIIGGNRESIEIVRQAGFQGSFAVIPQFGVDTDFFRPMLVDDLRQELGLADRFVIGFVGRYAEEKGIRTLIASLKQIDHLKLKPYTALLLSSMPPPSWLRQAAVELKEQILFLDQVSHAEFPRYMNLLDVLVLPSETQADWKEQFGRVMIEAMACGVPVIGSSSGAIPEVIKDQGWVFSEKDVDDLSEKIKFVLSYPYLRQTYQPRVRDYILQRYTHDQIVNQTIQAWQTIWPLENAKN